MSGYYEALAVDYANQALIKRAVATVYLENLNDEFFWKPQLEYVKAGTYNFVGSSRNESNIKTSGSAQCLKFKGLLSEKFFVCMDSDYLNNGDGIIHKLNEGFASLQSALNYPINLKQETAHYARLGLSKNNAYLRMRGHTLYNFINTIGNHVCKNTRVQFSSRILKIVDANQSRYTEMKNLRQDAGQILL